MSETPTPFNPQVFENHILWTVIWILVAAVLTAVIVGLIYYIWWKSR
jgi:hypothetical protein